MAIIYFDMDNVLANFNGAFSRELCPLEKPPERLEKYFYLKLKPIGSTIILLRKLLAKGHEVYIASKPTSHSEYCASEKYVWVRENIPEMSKRLILTGHKELLICDYLIDDHPERWSGFGGEVLYFNPNEQEISLKRIISKFRENEFV